MSLPMPTVHANEAFRSRNETFFVRSSMLARAERVVRIASGSSFTDRTRKVADPVRGASIGWGVIGTRALIFALTCLLVLNGVFIWWWRSGVGCVNAVIRATHPGPRPVLELLPLENDRLKQML